MKAACPALLLLSGCAVTPANHTCPDEVALAVAVMKANFDHDIPQQDPAIRSELRARTCKVPFVHRVTVGVGHQSDCRGGADGPLAPCDGGGNTSPTEPDFQYLYLEGEWVLWQRD